MFDTMLCNSAVYWNGQTVVGKSSSSNFSSSVEDDPFWGQESVVNLAGSGSGSIDPAESIPQVAYIVLFTV